jgi:hypothetical protein
MSTEVPSIVSNKCTEAIFRHGDVACAAECLITMQNPSQDCQHYHVDIQALLGKHDRVFKPLPAGRPHDRGFEHVIELEEWAKLMITMPYKHPKKFKDEIEKALQELLEMGTSGLALVPSLLQWYW